MRKVGAFDISSIPPRHRLPFYARGKPLEL
jgi:hypothetical protein